MLPGLSLGRNIKGGHFKGATKPYGESGNWVEMGGKGLALLFSEHARSILRGKEGVDTRGRRKKSTLQ